MATRASAEGITTDADVIVVGGGHNGLICAAYLARAGIDTLLLEARAEVGGCASTVSDLGARFNICNCDHNMIRAMPISEELDLHLHGLEYLEAEASGVNAFYDGSDPWVFFHETERTLESLAASYPGQVEGYQRYLRDAIPVAELVLEMARTRPSTAHMLAGVAAKRAQGGGRLLDWSRRSAADVFSRYFDDWHVTMPAIATGPTVWGVPPETPGTGLAAAAYATRHLVKTGRPRGGSGALTNATRGSFEAAGGRVRCDARVERLLVHGGRVDAVRLDDGSTLRAPVIVAACDPQRVFVDWLDEVPPAARRAVDRWRRKPVLDGYESKIDAVLTTAPDYRHADKVHAHLPGLDIVSPTTVISPSPTQLAAAHRDRAEGRVAECPTILVNTPSVLDPGMCSPDGHEVLSLEVLFTPYGISGGWPGSDEPRRWLELWSQFVEPGALDTIRDWRVMTPDRYEREFSMHRGHTPSFSTSPLAALFGRNRQQTRYRTPISGLYLSGAGTFPGAGVFGAAGRNTADAVRRDLQGPLGRRVAPVRRWRSGLGTHADASSV